MIDSLAQAEGGPAADGAGGDARRPPDALARAGGNRGALAGQHPRGGGCRGGPDQLDDAADRAGPDGG